MVSFPRRDLGRKGEDEAERYLRRKHRYRVVERNYTCRWGELDLVCLDGNTLVFVEVRSSGVGGFEGPAESVNERKQRQIIKAAQSYIQRKRLREVSMRFDVLGIEFRAGGRPRFALFQNAFELPPD